MGSPFIGMKFQDSSLSCLDINLRCLCINSPAKILKSGWECADLCPGHSTGLTHDEALRVRELLEEFPEILVPLFVGGTQHLQNKKKKGLGEERGQPGEQWEWEKTGAPQGQQEKEGQMH